MQIQINTELLASLYENEEIQALTSPKLKRIDASSARWYEDEQGEKYLGATSFVSLTQLAHETKYLTFWREQLLIELGSSEKVNEFVAATAHYGTTFHLALADLVKEGSISQISFVAKAKERLQQFGFTGSDSVMLLALADLVKDFASVVQFFADKKPNGLEILAIELPVKSKLWGTATQIDLVLRIKGKICLVNLKSSRKGSVPSHVQQLFIEKKCFIETFPQLAKDEIYCFILNPKDWRKKPTYDFKHHAQVDSAEMKELMEAKLSLAQAHGIMEHVKRNRVTLSEDFQLFVEPKVEIL